MVGNNGFTTDDYPQPEVWADVLRTAGLTQFEYFADHMEPAIFKNVWQNKSEFFRATMDTIDKYGLKVFSGATARISYALNMLSHPYPDMRREARAWCEAFIDMSVALGAKYVSGHYDCISKIDVEKNFETAKTRMIDQMIDLTHYAKEKGIAGMFLEQMHRPQLLPYTIEGAHEILGRINEKASVPVHIHIDLGHIAFVEGYKEHGPDDRSIETWLATPFGYNEILLIHAQQCDTKASRHWPFTKKYNEIGVVDGIKAIQAVEESGVKDCYIALEILFPRSTDIDVITPAIVESADYWREAFSGAGYTENEEGAFVRG